MNEEQCSNKRARHMLSSYPTRSLREYLAYQSVHHSEETEMQFQQVEIDQQDQKMFRFEVEVEVGDGRSQVIVVDEATNIEKEADQFCKKYKLDSHVSELLANTIREKYESEMEQTLNESMARQLQSLTEVYSNVHAREVLMTNSDSATIRYQHKKQPEQRQKDSQDKGASKLLKNYYSKSKKYSLSENYLFENKQNQPEINRVSHEICEKLGKENIIQHKNRKSKEKYNHILREKQQKEEELMRECPFKPKINTISKQVDRQIAESHTREQKRQERFNKLYQNHRQLQLKKEQERQNYIMEIPFKPNINYISKKIMESKKSMNALDNNDKNERKNHMICNYSSNNSQPHTGRGPKSRNLEKLPIGDYLYNQAMRKSKPKIQLQKGQIKALEYSDYLISNLKEKCINQIFTELSSPPHDELYCTDINLSSPAFKFGKYKYFLPIFNEMIEMDISVTRDEFLDASLKLFKLLSPEEKHEIILKKEKEYQQNEQISHILVNSKSRSILKRSGYEKIDIYNRGVEHRKYVDQKNQKNRQERARDELRQCTFKPIVHQFM